MDRRQRYAIIGKYKKKFADFYHIQKDDSGIYVLGRYEDGFKYAYIGQSVHMLTRLAEHCIGHEQHIDLSIRSHGLKLDGYPNGWQLLEVIHTSELDKQEQIYIKRYALLGYQLYNKTTGSQGEGKKAIAEHHVKGYYSGIERGENRLRKELNYIIEKYLTIGLKKDNKLSRKALDKFYTLLEVDNDTIREGVGTFEEKR